MSRAGDNALKVVADTHAAHRVVYPLPPVPPPIILAQRIDVNGHSYDKRADLDDPAVKRFVAEALALGLSVVVPENGRA